jgi:hypothetical protein
MSTLPSPASSWPIFRERPPLGGVRRQHHGDAVLPKGASIRDILKGYHALADGKCYVDVSFHLIISDQFGR